MNPTMKYIFYVVLAVVVLLTGKEMFFSNNDTAVNPAVIPAQNAEIQTNNSQNTLNSQKGEIKMVENNVNNSAWDKTKEAGSNAWEATKEGAANAGDAIAEKSGDAWDATKEGAGKAWDKTKEVSGKAWQATKDGAAKAHDAMTD